MAGKLPQTVAPTKHRELVKVKTAARVLDVSVDTIDRLARRGQLEIIRLPTGARRIDLTALDCLIEDWTEGGR